MLDQCILLSLCLDVKNNNPRHGLTTEEMFPYVRRVQKNPNNWIVHSQCLLIKSRLEFESSKTADRAVLQMQVRAHIHTYLCFRLRLLIYSWRLPDRVLSSCSFQVLMEQFFDEEQDLKKKPHEVVRERAAFLFATAFPCRLSLQRELGDRFLTMGMAASALAIFEQFELWENVITCYRVMSKNQKVWPNSAQPGVYALCLRAQKENNVV